MIASVAETFPSSTSRVDFYDSGITTKVMTSRCIDRCVSFDDWNNHLNAGSFIYGEIIPNLERKLAMEGKVDVWMVFVL